MLDKDSSETPCRVNDVFEYRPYNRQSRRRKWLSYTKLVPPILTMSVFLRIEFSKLHRIYITRIASDSVFYLKNSVTRWFSLTFRSRIWSLATDQVRAVSGSSCDTWIFRLYTEIRFYPTNLSNSGKVLVKPLDAAKSVRKLLQCLLTHDRWLGLQELQNESIPGTVFRV